MGFFLRWFGLTLVLGVLRAEAADAWQHVSKESHSQFPGDEIQFIKNGTADGHVWIGTLSGAVRIADGAMHPLVPAKDLRVWDISERPGGGLWVGHSEGALLLDGDRVVKTLGNNTVAPLQNVGGKIWAIVKNGTSTRNSLMQADGDAWSPVALFENRKVDDLLSGAKGTFWLIIEGDGVIEFDPKTGMDTFRHHLPRLTVTGILNDSKGQTWCGLWGGGVMVLKDDGMTRHLGDERSAVLALVEDKTGTIWAATSGNGVWVFDGNTWEGKLQEEGAINLLKATSDGRVWVSTQQGGGLRYWDGKAWVWSLESGMPVRCLTELPNGVLMAGGVLDGIYILGDYSIKGE